MLPFLTTDRRDAVPIMPVTAATLSTWIERHPQWRQWLSSVGFRGAPGTFAFLPAADGRATGVIASPAEDAPVFAFAGLATALPEGRYVIEPEGARASP